MSALYFGLLQLLFFVFASGENCSTLDGTWFDEYGSQLRLSLSQDGSLSGHYKPTSGNEFGNSNGSSAKHTLIGKAAFNQTGAVFGFSIQLHDASLVKSWTGQCVMCAGQEILETTWLVRKKAKGCSDEYLTTNIGLTAFTHQSPRMEQYSGGRRMSSPSPPKSGQYVTSKRVVSNRVTRVPSTRSNSTSQPCSLDGTWYNELGSEMILTVHENMTLTGEYRTAVERYPGAAGPSFSKIYGLAVPSQPKGGFAMHVIWSNGTSVTGWAGQCHLCGANQTETLFTTWVLRSRIQSCGDNWKSTLFGENTFTRQEQKIGPRKRLGIHTPARPTRAPRTTSTA